MEDGTLLVGTDGNGVFSIDTRTEKYSSAPLEGLTSLEKADVRAIYKDSRNRIWFGTDGQGVWLTKDKLDNPINFSAGQSKSISHNRIRSIVEDSKGQIWIGTRGRRTQSF